MQYVLMLTMRKARNSVRRNARRGNAERGGRGVRTSACGLRPKQAANLYLRSLRFREARPVQLSVEWHLVARCPCRCRVRCRALCMTEEVVKEVTLEVSVV